MVGKKVRRRNSTGEDEGVLGEEEVAGCCGGI